MKRTDGVKPQNFHFKNMTREEMVEKLDKNFPISLKYSEDLINRIHSKYPIISKADVAKIVIGFFKGFRELLVLGKVISIKDLCVNCKFYFFKRYKTTLKMRLTTPLKLKKTLHG